MRQLTIISGGQSGVDRAALDAAIALKIPYGGWCPKGGWAVDYPDPPGLLARYPLLKETPLSDPAQRTQWNVRDSDATLILVTVGGMLASAGTTLASKAASQRGKPLLIVDMDRPESWARVRVWLAERIATGGQAPFRLNIAGPRESEAKGIYANGSALLHVVLSGIV